MQEKKKEDSIVNPHEKAYYSDKYRAPNLWVRQSGIPRSVLTAGDIDLVTRTGYNGVTDKEGRLKLLEFKQYNGQMGEGQTITYHKIDRLLRAGDKYYNKGREYTEYAGLYLCQAAPEFWLDYHDQTYTIKVNGRTLYKHEFLDFLRGRYEQIAPYQITKTW